jgi:quercetin dioxygenase-like cupin family protein
MNVVDLRLIDREALVGPQQGTSRIFIWCVSSLAGRLIGLHRHDAEEIFRILSGRIRCQIDGETRDVGPGEIIVIPPKAVHAYRTLEDAELEVYGLIGAREFMVTRNPDGSTSEEEVFVRELPWTATPPDESLYITREERIRRYVEWYRANPF